MAVNPLGYVAPADGANPRIIGGIAFETISGGQFCVASGAANCVTSGLSSLASTDIGVALGGSGAGFNGIAIQDVTSGNYVGLATKGLVIVRAGGTIVNGQPVCAIDGDCVAPIAAVSGANVPVMVTQAIKVKIGRAWSNATSGNFALIELNS